MHLFQRLGFKVVLATLLFAFGLIVMAGCGDDQGEYIAEVDAWHTERLERLSSDTGWLTLVGLHPLGHGENIIGSGQDNDVVMTSAAPVRLGTVTIKGEDINFAVAEGVLINVERSGDDEVKAFAGGELASDASGAADKLMTGSLVFYVVQRGDKFFLRVKDRQSEVYTSFKGIERFPVNPAWRIEARLEGEAGTMRVANVLGQVSVEPTPGTLVFEWNGETYRLHPTGKAGEELFIVFGDATNGSGTYPGGRFLVTSVPDSDGMIVLDFNQAYNPPCAFTEYATCELPGLANTLGISVAAGEKVWGTGH
ncbi:MAG: hypothetical protein ACI9UK_001677 [Candidatus Krumholzibacteriia bacterium]|jgi:uncharacterized protein (DUF1684 family)